MDSEKLKALQEALAPIVRYIEINDSDTMSRITPDRAVVSTASGSWTGSTDITLGDLRKLAALARELG